MIKNGTRLFQSTLSFEKKTIRVKARLLQNKTIPVKIHIKGKVANGYEYVDATCVPEEIEIAGSARKLARYIQTGYTDRCDRFNF